MGTRNLTIVKLGGEYRVAQFGQWDGYPSGNGATILEFLRSWDRHIFEGKLMDASFLTDLEIAAINAKIKAEGLQNEWQQRWPALTRDTGAKILKLVEDSPPGIKLRNEIAFAGDSLMCEWAYVLDLDVNKLEVYRGFNRDPLTEADRFFGIKPEDSKFDPPYYQIKIAASYPLDTLPTVEAMSKDCQRNPE